MKKIIIYASLAAALALMSSCKKNDTTPTPATTNTFKITIENISTPKKYFAAGSFSIPDGDATAGPATPGKSFKFTFDAPIGSKLSFVSMFGQSNDIFFSPDTNGIALYNGRTPVTGDVTNQVKLWDAGTEVNQEPGVGQDQAPRESGPNVGVTESNYVQSLSSVTDGFTYPSVSNVIQVMINHVSGSKFEVVIKNVSTVATLITSNGPMAAPNSPGAWVIYSSGAPFFIPGQKDWGFGLESLAEDGAPSTIGAYVQTNAGYVSPISPGTFVVHKSGSTPIFTVGALDRKQGLEAQAEDANPTGLVSSLTNNTDVITVSSFTTKVGGASAGPIKPGEKFEFTFSASTGDYFSFASMLGESNDYFFAFSDKGIALYNGSTPINGDVSSQIYLWNAGTEVNQYPGAGPDQAPRQTAPNTGDSESVVITTIDKVNDGFIWPAASSVIRVKVTPQ